MNSYDGRLFPGATLYSRRSKCFRQIIDLKRRPQGDLYQLTRAEMKDGDMELRQAYPYKGPSLVEPSQLLNPNAYGKPDFLFQHKPYEEGEWPEEWIAVPSERFLVRRAERLYSIYLDSRNGHHDRIFVCFGSTWVQSDPWHYSYPSDWTVGMEIVCKAPLKWVPVFRRLIQEGAIAHIISLCAYLDSATRATIDRVYEDLVRTWYRSSVEDLHHGDYLEVDWAQWEPK